ncbi:MAG TPA: hypothetical protein IAA29_04610 [Candidatus Paenibacillus intestinavium]|nr:hypothetical protein [Candidatus Paenibacillus intestinavium]
MNMHTWRERLRFGVQRKYMSHKLLKSYSEEWIWEHAIVEPMIIQAVHEQLKEYDELVLQWLLHGKGSAITEQEQLIKAMKAQLHISGQQALCSLLNLAGLGVIQCIKHPWRGQIWQMPYPIFHNWRPVMKRERQYWQQAQHMNIDHYAIDQGNNIPLGKTLMYVLLEMSNLDLRYTKKGELAKLTRDKLISHSASINNEFFQEYFPQPLKESYGASLNFLLELAHALQLIEETEHGLKLNMEHINDWLLLHEWQREVLHMQWMCEFFGVLSYYESIAGIISELITCDAGVWYEATELSKPLQMWLSMWQSCGWLTSLSEKNTDCKKHIVVQRQVFALHSQSQLAIQDNGEIIVLPGASYRQLWLLEQIAERLSEQEIIIYKLTVAGLVHAMKNGYTLNQIKQWLQMSCDHDMPQIVSHLLEAAQMTYEESNQHARLSSHLIGEDRHKGSTAKKIADAYVKMPRSSSILPMKVECQSAFHLLRPIEQWGKWLAATNPLFAEPVLEHEELYELQAASQYGLITPSWLTECRQYHDSTSKQIVQCAIDYQLSLYIEKADRSIYFHPSRIVEIGNKWVIEGVNDRQQTDEIQWVQLNDWQGIKLHIATV